MLKKILSLLLAILMLLSLAACTSSRDDDDDDDRKHSSSNKKNDDKDSNDDEDDNDDDNSSNAVTDNDDVDVDPDSRITFQKTIFIDDENCTFTIKSIDPNGDWGYTLDAFLENKTDLELMFSLDNVSVNGFMCDPFWASLLPAGKKVNDEISFYEDTLKDLGIKKVTEITFTLTVYDYNDYTADPLAKEVFTIYPMGEDAVEAYVRTPTKNEIVLFENEEVSMIIIDQFDDPTWGYTLVAYLENNTSDTLIFSADDVAVNGFMCDPFWSSIVAPGKRAIVNISWYDDSFAENDITEVESIDMSITVYDYSDWMADYLIDDNFTIDPNF